jgi:hypothetical protein
MNEPQKCFSELPALLASGTLADPPYEEGVMQNSGRVSAQMLA